MNKKVIVIGAGVGGLSVAALLAKKGYEVKILEKNNDIGGRAGVFKENGFTFDMGPTWYLMPDIFENYYAEFGKKPEDFMNLQRLDPSYRIFFEKGDIVDIPAAKEKIFELFDSLELGGADSLKKYLKVSKLQYEIAKEKFLYADFEKLTDLIDYDVIKKGSKIRALSNIGSFARRYFTNEKLIKILLYNIVFLGGSPKNIPALYSIMAYVDFDMGVFYPQGGMGKFVESLERLADMNGVEIKLNHEVEKIDPEKKSIKTNQGEFNYDILVSSADYHHTETKLLDRKYQTYPEKYWQKRTMAPSAFIMYLGVNKKIDKLKHHSLFFDYDWEEHFDSIFSKKPTWPEYPSFYTCTPTRTDNTIAPPGSDIIFVLVPVASGLEDEDEFRHKYFRKIIKRIEDNVGENISDNIITKKIFAHREFIERYNAYQGTSLGLTHTLMQSLTFRPSHRSKKVKDMYYVGQYTHPGIGIPTSLISSQIVKNIITKKDGK